MSLFKIIDMLGILDFDMSASTCKIKICVELYRIISKIYIFIVIFHSFIRAAINVLLLNILISSFNFEGR